MKSTACILLLSLLFTLSPVSADTEGPLRESVTAFWNASVGRDKVTAMKYVHPDDLNTFLNKKAVVIRKWEISDISINPDSGEAMVRIAYSMETYPGTAFNLVKVDTWQLVEDEWKVRIKNQSAAAMKALFGNAASQAAGPEEKSLRIRPDKIRFYKTNTSQPAFIWIENYLDIPARLTVLEVDQDLIEIAEQPELINPGEKARIRLQYIGKENVKENQTTEVLLEIKSGENVIKRTIPAVYNYINSAMRWIQQQQRTRPPE